MRSLVSYGFLAPPVLFITLSLVGAIAALLWRRFGITVVLVSTLCLYVAATPAFSSYLAYQLETQIPSDIDFTDAEAIVVLGADVRRGDGRNSDRIGPASLERLVLAVDAYRRLHLPIAVSGGRVAELARGGRAAYEIGAGGIFWDPGHLERGGIADDLRECALHGTVAVTRADQHRGRNRASRGSSARGLVL
jgi:uncharacterized SAM-binding protein YcdF (DUF218 family)